jgi:hypothetical protein
MSYGHVAIERLRVVAVYDLVKVVECASKEKAPAFLLIRSLGNERRTGESASFRG